MPLMVYVGGSSETRRSKDALIRRAANAAKRGWTWERMQSMQNTNETQRGGEHCKGGEQWKGKGKQKGKGVHTYGHRKPSDDKGTGGEGGRGGGQLWRQRNTWPTRGSGEYHGGGQLWRQSNTWHTRGSGE